MTRPGGKVIFVDYHQPHRANPLRYLMQPVLRTLEPFALDLWNTPIETLLPKGLDIKLICSRQYCGGLYQKVILER